MWIKYRNGARLIRISALDAIEAKGDGAGAVGIYVFRSAEQETAATGLTLARATAIMGAITAGLEDHVHLIDLDKVLAEN
jgi:hypothetical protein